MSRGLTILFGLATVIAATNGAANESGYSAARDRQRAKVAVFSGELGLSRPAAGGARMKGDTEPASGTDITDEVITIKLTPATDEFRVASRVTMLARSALSTSSFMLTDVTVTSVVNARDGDHLAFNHAGGVLTVAHGRTLAAGETTTFVVTAEGPLRCDGSSPYCVVEGRISHLFGVFMHPVSESGPLADRFSLDLTVDAPSGLLVNGPGRRMPVVVENDRRRHRFVSFEPTPWVTLSVGEMVTTETKALTAAGEIPVRIATLSSYSSTHGEFANHTAAAVEFFASLFTPYPYGKLDVAMCNRALSGGIATQATFYISERLFMPASADWKEVFLEVFSHETAHQWFGNHVAHESVRANWLSEGFAEYLAIMHSRARTGSWAHLHGGQDEYMTSVGPGRDGPIDGPGPNAYVPVVYFKGAAVLHMLRRLVGDTAFFSGVRAYLEENAGERVPIAVFERAMAGAAGTNLTAFFNVWLRDTGYPKLLVSTEMASTDDGLIARVTLSEPSGRAFPMRLPIEVMHERGIARVEAVLEKASQTFSVPIPAFLVGVKVDAAREALRYLQPALPADVNGSGRVDGGDLLDLAAGLGAARGGDGWDEMNDVDGNNEVNMADLNAIKGNWGRTIGGT